MNKQTKDAATLKEGTCNCGNQSCNCGCSCGDKCPGSGCQCGCDCCK